MSEPIRQDQKDDVVATDQLRVTCDGHGRGGHPRVYLTMVDDDAGQPSHVVCPYCSRVFKFHGVA